MIVTTTTSFRNFFLIKLWIVMLFSVMLSFCTFAQNIGNATLQTTNYKDLLELFDALPSDSLNRKKSIAKIYLYRSKSEQDTINLGNAYYLFSVISKQPLIGKSYADSIIEITKNSNDFTFPAIGYYLKGYWCYELSQYQEALDNYLTGDSIAKSRSNISQYIKYKTMIALLKNRAGDHRGALEIYLEEVDSLSAIKSNSPENHTNYLNRLYNTSLTYMRLKKLDSAKIYSKKGLNESFAIEDSIVNFEFMYNLGVIEFLSGNENIALNNINKALPHLDNYSRAMAYYYKGKIAIDNEFESDAHKFFRISDSIAGQLNYTFTELRSIYEFKLEFYENNLDLQQQLVYINKLLKLDSTLNRSKDLRLEIEKKYIRPILLHKKENIINTLRNKNRFGRIIILLLGTVTIILVFTVVNYMIRQKRYLKKFKNLIEKDKVINSQKLKDRQSVEVIPIDIYNKIASELKKFEVQNDFLQPITVMELAKKLDTNSTYLSKFININTGSNFSQYLNRLRIRYVVERLKSDPKLRSFTMKAIAEEIGFGTAKSFSNAFFLETEIYPSYFIRKLNNN